MADFLSSLVQDPKRLEALSQFLLGFGRSAAVAGQRGFSTAGGLAVGFGAGGDALIQTGVRQQLADLRQQEIEQREAQLAEQEGTKRALNQTFSTQVIDPGVAGAPRAQAAQQAATARAGGSPLLQNVAANISAEGGDPRLAASFLSSAVATQSAEQRAQQASERQARAIEASGAKQAATIEAGFERQARGLEAQAERTQTTQDAADRRAQARIEAADRRFDKALKAKTQTARTKAQALPPQTRRGLIEQNQSIERVLTQLPGVKDALSAIGLVGAGKEVSTEILGQIPGALGEKFSFPEVVRDATKIRVAREELIKAMAKNPKVALAEQERIANLLPATGVFKSERAAKEKLSELTAALKRLQSENESLLATQPSGGGARFMMDAEGNILTEIQ